MAVLFNWFILLLTLLTCLNVPVSSLYEDQIGKFDWIKRGVGSIVFAEFESSGSAEGGPAARLVVATAHNVLAVLNTKNGDIIWRQVLDVGPGGALESLSVSDGEISVVCGNPPLLRTFDVNNAAVLSETTFGLPHKHQPAYGRRLVSHVGKTITVAHLTVGAVDLTRVNTKAPTATALRRKLLQPWISKESPCGLTPSHLVCLDASLGSVLSVALDDWKESTNNFVSVTLQSIGLTVNAGVDIDADCPPRHSQLSVEAVHGSPHHLVLQSGSSRVLVSTAGGDGVRVVGAGTVGGAPVSVAPDGVLYTVVQDKQTVRISAFSASSGAELVSRSLTVEVSAGEQAGVRQLTVQQFARRGDGEVAVRALVVLSDDSVHMLAPPTVMWSREEALSSVLTVESVDLPVPASSVSMHDHISQRAGILGALVQRVMLQCNELLGWLTEVLEGTLSSSDGSHEAQHRLNRDEFNLHKLLVLSTSPGKVFALDNWTGAIVWSSYLPGLRPLASDKMLLHLQRSVAHFPHPPQMALIAMNQANCHGVLYTFNPLTGEAVADGLQLLDYRISQASLLQQNDKQFIKPVLIVDTSLGVHVFPPSAEGSVVLPHKDVLYVTMRNSTSLQGYSLRASKSASLQLTPVWSSQFPPGRITGVYTKRPSERVHSSGRVMADRSVLYKYTNPNLAVVTSQGWDHPDKKRGNSSPDTLNVYLVDLVSGAVVDWIHHKSASGPVHVMHSENWVVYTYYHETHRRNEVHSLELFEGLTQSNASAFSSLSGAPLAPIVERQAYILPHGVQAAAHTITEKSITTKYLLLALNNGGVVQVARWLVDPRRPLTSAGPREEGLMPYVPEIPLPPTEVISYNQSLPRVNAIYSAPTGLESTSIVFVYGLDLFFTRVFPSKMFDMLKDDFDYFLIVGVLLSLVVCAVVTRRLAQRKALYHLWK